MAPSTESKPMYAKDERALCFHGELLYEAKVLEFKRIDPKDKQSAYEYRVHYKGWKNTWDDWVPQDRLRKYTEENLELASNLKKELHQNQQPPKSATKPTKGRRGPGSDGGSEDRHSSVPAGGRGTKRGRDNDIEKVGSKMSVAHVLLSSSPLPGTLATPTDESPATKSTSRTTTAQPERTPKSTPEKPEFQAQDTPKTPGPRTGDLPDLRSMTIETASDRMAIDPETDEAPDARRVTRRVIEKKLAQPARRSKRQKEISEKEKPRLSPQPDDGDILETVDEILARDPPPDEPEYISRQTAQSSRAKYIFAPLIGGTTMDEKLLIKQEIALAAEKKAAKDQPKESKIKPNPKKPHDPPLVLDPPGTGGPYDALRFPEQLVDTLNQRPLSDLYGWDVKALKKIPTELVEKLHVDAIADLPYEVVVHLSPQIIDKIPENSVFFRNLPANSKFKRPRQRAPSIQTKSSDPSSNPTPLPKSNMPRIKVVQQGQPTQNFVLEKGEDGKMVRRLVDFCSYCRENKKKCNGARPCNICVERGLICGPYNDTPSEPSSDSGFSAAMSISSAEETDDTLATPRTKTGLQTPPESWKKAEPKPSAHPIAPAQQTVDGVLSDFLAYIHGNPTCITLEKDGPRAYISAAQEESFHNRPSIRITIPDTLKNLLVDDWENVTKNMQLVPLPSRAPANFIIDTYWNEEKEKRRLGSAEADILQEFCAGLKVYFEKSLGKILLYRFERGQLAEIRQLWESGKYPDWEGKGFGDAYGAEHLARMLTNMPEMIAQTNMDAQSIARLKEEISKFTVWLSRNSGKFFVLNYEQPSTEYKDAARLS